MVAPCILPLEACLDPRLVGGKAAGLAQLIRHGFAIPPGICLTTAAYRAALQQAGIDPAQWWTRLELAASDDRQRLCAEWQERIRTLDLPSSILDALQAELSRLTSEHPAQPPDSWAIRSSATNEDGATSSFAGVYRTLLGAGQRELPRAIARCWASLWTEAAVSYHQRASLKTPPEMAVVIQPVLSAISAGVAYSCHPITGRTDVVVVNAVWGLAEPLVSGIAVPDQYVVIIAAEDRSSTSRTIERQIAEKPTRRVATSAGLRDESVPEHMQKEAAVKDQDLRRLATLVKTIERVMAKPVDIEWAIDERGLWLLQARPLTVAATWSGLTHADCEWSRANFKETLPELPSPLGLSFMEDFMENNFLRHYREIGCVIPPGLRSMKVVRGRPYINVTLFESLVVQLGGDVASVREQMGGETTSIPTRAKRLPLWQLLIALVQLLRKIRQGVTRSPAWFAEMKRMEALSRGWSIANLSPAELLARMEELGAQLQRGDLTFGIATGVAQGFQVLQWVLEGSIGDGWRPLLNRALQGQGTVISAGQVLRLIELAEIARREPTAQAFLLAEPWQPELYRTRLHGTDFLAAFDAYREEYGHRAIGESDIATPRFADQPDYVLGVIRRHVQTPPARSAAEIQQQQKTTQCRALREIRERLGWRWIHRALFTWWHRRLCRSLSLRETNRHHLMYFSTAVRRLILTLGKQWATEGRLASPEDIFFLTADELRAAVMDAQRAWNNVVAERRAEWQRQAAQTVPDFLSPGEAPATLSSAPGRNSRTCRGIPISAGTAEGPVRLIRSLADLHRVTRGDILVVSVIDPGMAPLFGLAAGLVAEIGGTLSHGAIIAREYGLPTVANVPGVTSFFKDGERVVVDATRGEVRRW